MKFGGGAFRPLKGSKKTLILVSILCSLFLVGITYAFFIVKPTSQNEDISAETGTLSLTFSDGNDNIIEALEFGSSVEKTFTIENTGTLDAYARILWEDLVNTYLEGSLTFSLSYKTSGSGEYTDLITNENVPRNTESSTKTLIDTLLIPTNSKYFYKLEISLNYLEDVDQTEDLKAIFNTHFKLEQGTSKYTITFVNEEGESSTKEVLENATYGELPTPTKAGFVFKGWYTEPNGGGEEITSETRVNIKSDIRLYPHFKEASIDSTIKKLNPVIKTETIDYNYVSPLPTYKDNGFTETRDSGNIVGCSNANYYCYSSSYKFDEHTGLYSLVNPSKGIANDIHSQMSNKYAVSCFYGKTTELTDIVKYVNYSSLCNYKYQKSLKPTIVSYEEDSGIYKIESNNEVSYFYRGDINNNYVKFANFYWRILKINSNGSIKIVYDGTSPHENGESSTDRIAISNVYWNHYQNDAKYVGYMFGGASGEKSTSKEQAQTNQTNSSIKTTLENWYANNIEKSGYSKFVSDEVFCNDRSIISGQGYGGSGGQYGAYKRLYTEKKPDLSCDSNDSFTVSSEKGNGKLSKQVGLITADELSIAGMRYYSDNKRSYLYKGSDYWTMTPWSGDIAIVHSAGYIISSDENRSNTGVVPVINLTAEYVSDMIGDGSQTNPYREQGLEP